MGTEDERVAASRHAIVLTSCANSADARALSRALLDARLAACVQMLPITSAYIWNGTVHDEDEVLLLIKGRTADFKAIEASILELHSYELPEIVQIPLIDGLDRYLAWLDDPS
jgi:periplasmic divalent cation tolerance protein